MNVTPSNRRFGHSQATAKLLYRYSRPGRITSPSYATLGKVTGLCRASMREGRRRLEAAKLLCITRCICRRVIERVTPWHGGVDRYLGTVQAANVYALTLPRLLLVPMKPSSGSREKAPPAGFSKANEAPRLPLGDGFSPVDVVLRRLRAGVGRI